MKLWLSSELFMTFSALKKMLYCLGTECELGSSPAQVRQDMTGFPVENPDSSSLAF